MRRKPKLTEQQQQILDILKDGKSRRLTLIFSELNGDLVHQRPKRLNNLRAALGRLRRRNLIGLYRNKYWGLVK